MSGGATIVIRRARHEDGPVIRRVAERDCAPAPAGEVIVAEVDGEIRAWVELATGRVGADPFHGTAPLVEMLELRAAQLRAGQRPMAGSPARVVFRRLRRAAVATSG